MRSTIRRFGTTALVAVVVICAALSMTGCKEPGVPTLTGITAVYKGTAKIYPTTPLNNLKANLTVTAQYNDNSSETLANTDYFLSGTLTVGTRTIIVSYEDKTTNFTVTVSAPTPDETTPGETPPGETPPGGTTYTVTFSINEGSGTAPATQTVSSGYSMTLPYGSVLSKTGYLFGGWNTSSDGTGTNYDAGSSYIVTGNITLYAKWVVAYTVTFDDNGVSWSVNTITAQSGSSITLPNANGFYITWGTFIGWNTKADGTGTNYNGGSSYTVTSNITLFANWEVTTYTITFNANGGSGTVPESRTVPTGYSTTLPDGNFSLVYVDFAGWNIKADGTGTNYTINSTYTPTGNKPTIILYAKWENLVPFSSVTGFANKLAWLAAHGQNDTSTSYIIEATTDEIIAPQALSYGDRSGITITLRGVGANRIISLSSNGTMFTVGSGVTLTLESDITLQGHSNIKALVRINSGGTLIINEGSTISGNSSISNGDYGGGVYVYYGTLTMNGGTISGNSTTSNSYNYGGGGVYVMYGSFIMNDGIISSNTSSNYGCGVYVVHGTFTMNGGTISGNSTSNSIFSSRGGGVYVDQGTFSMSGGTISGNSTISNSDSYGGGVYVMNQGSFFMSGGTISGNSTICHSSYSTNYGGGGVYMDGGTFTKIGGTIYGYDSNDSVNSNVVKNGSNVVQSNRGHAVYGGSIGSVILHRETTAGPTVNLSCGNGIFSGGWEF